MKPCQECGGEKSRGKGKKLCDKCAASRPCRMCRQTLKYPAELRRATCNGCHSAEQRERNKRDRDAYYRRKAMRRYALSESQFNSLMTKSVCDVCGNPPTELEGPGTRLHIDHDHGTGKVRGMLCARCNRALGQARDSRDLLLKLADYLSRNGSAQ